jgi:hypothetical protein
LRPSFVVIRSGYTLFRRFDTWSLCLSLDPRILGRDEDSGMFLIRPRRSVTRRMVRIIPRMLSLARTYELEKHRLTSFLPSFFSCGGSFLDRHLPISHHPFIRRSAHPLSLSRLTSIWNDGKATYNRTGPHSHGCLPLNPSHRSEANNRFVSRPFGFLRKNELYGLSEG